jgi:hypothetical protein|tara:strand:- start:1507 stop:1971 length:465 start_codon:yes stop_codon:yes gene_type:complete
MERLTIEQSKEYIPVKENYSDTSIEAAEYFTLTPAKDGWENVTYYTAKKRGIYNKKGEGDQWVYVLRNSSMPGLYKVGYTKLTPDERAKQLSNATGVPVPYEVAWAYRCFNGELLESEVHHAMKPYRVNNQREFFRIRLGDIQEIVEKIGKQFK